MSDRSYLSLKFHLLKKKKTKKNTGICGRGKGTWFMGKRNLSLNCHFLKLLQRECILILTVLLKLNLKNQFSCGPFTAAKNSLFWPSKTPILFPKDFLEQPSLQRSWSEWLGPR